MKIDVSRIPYEEVEKVAAGACLEVVNIARVGKRIVLECAEPKPMAFSLEPIVF